MRIITVSRQFGSGGRELGKRLSDALDWDYYDREIIQTLAEEEGLDPSYVRHALANHGWHDIQLTYRHSFSQLMFDHGMRTQLLVRQRKVIQQIAESGNDCIIVGRDADVILQGYRPFRLFICAEEQARLRRCMAHEAKQPEEEQLSEKEVLRNIRRIDRNRTRTREVLTGKAREDGSAFDLTFNVTDLEIKRLVAPLADFALRWFEVTGR